MNHVTCTVHNGFLTITRNGSTIGTVREIFDEPTILLKNSVAWVQLTQTDCDIIWDCWNAMVEMSQQEKS